jgi:hypothetical protein
MGRLVVFALFATPLLAAPVPKGKPKIEEPSVNGTWQVVERINNGRPVRSRDCECWVIADDTYTFFLRHERRHRGVRPCQQGADRGAVIP